MATISNEKLILQVPQVPVLPMPLDQYDPTYQSQFINVLRLYFAQLNNVIGSVTGSQGGQFVDCPNGLFFNTADQTFASANTAYPIVYNQTYLSHGVALQSGSTSRVAVSVGGIYNFQYTGQVLSTNSSAKNIYVWISRNGTDIGYSTRAKTIASNGQYTDVTWGFDIDLQKGDYIELKVSVTDTALALESAVAASPHPGIPSSVLTVNFIAPLPNSLPTPP